MTNIGYKITFFLTNKQIFITLFVRKDVVLAKKF